MRLKHKVDKIFFIILSLLFFGCENLSGPIDTRPQTIGIQLKWIGCDNYDGSYEYIWTTDNVEITINEYGEEVDNNLPPEPPGFGDWDYYFECSKIELFQQDGYFNIKTVPEGYIQQINLSSNNFVWVEK